MALARIGVEDGPPTAGGPESGGPLLTIQETAWLLRRSPQAIYKLVERHQLPGVTRLGRRLYVRRTELLRSLAEGRASSPARSR